MNHKKIFQKKYCILPIALLSITIVFNIVGITKNEGREFVKCLIYMIFELMLLLYFIRKFLNSYIEEKELFMKEFGEEKREEDNIIK